ncbi:PE family protein [Mycobacterium terramassiliense]|uniref:PE family protein n=1 Tax=Mycobacterium terramassiliense TaxID=1841859 RepID=A0A2U3NCL1_9MYCO|nr:PE family protein [Mycobacterium terramassiliense]SPM29271.1 PE family protein [Mycobacterium terramassiliense]
MRVITEALTTAAGDLSSIGATTSEANAAAAVSTAAIAPAAADEISGAIAQAFSAQGQQWQQVSAAAQELYQRFVLAMQASAAAYQQAEAEIVGWLGGLGSLFMSGAVGPTVPGLPPDGSKPLVPQLPPPPPFLQ